ncbi:MAG: hypothetical protein J6R08_04090 [Opitutales bacterium]|nr:hypothetical protein [Opitutales bacterium]
MKNKKLIIIGGEGNAGIMAACVEDNRKRFGDDEWKVEGFINDYEKTVCGYSVLGGLKDIPILLQNPEYYFMWGIHMIGRNIFTEKLFRQANIPESRFAKIVHHSAFVSDNCELDAGVFVMANSYIGPNTKIGKCTMIMANSSIGHNTKIAPLCHLALGSITGSYVSVGLCSDICMGARVIEKNNVGNFAIAAASALVRHNIPDYEIHAGIPAKFLKRIRED